MEPKKPRYPAGRPPHDALNGFRVGGLAGALAGAAVTFIAGVTHPWLLVAGAVVGGSVGYVSEKRRQSSS